jgi:Family of unknown function (DUF695)
VRGCAPFRQTACVLRRSYGPTVDEASQSAGWHVFEGQYDGRPLLARFNAALRDARDRSTFPIQIGVAVPLNAPDDRGMPSEAELAELAALEERVIKAAAGHAVLVGSITTNSMREFVLYSQSPEWIESFDHALQAAVEGHEVQVMARSDPDWNVYGQFIE